MDPTVVIVGASVRALAQSAVRAGLKPICADCFADADLLRICQATQIKRYPQDLADFVQQAPQAPWMYTGGLENYPEIVRTLEEQRFLWGNGSEVLRAVRNPFVGLQALRNEGLCVPDTLVWNPEIPNDGAWLLKSIRSSGGMRVTVHAGQHRLRPGDYCQKKIDGKSCSAVYLATSEDTLVLGCTEQLIDQTWTGAAPFAYAGSVGPVTLSLAVQHDVLCVGNILREQFGLRGLFGVDGIVADDRFWSVDINPRYPASTEILERASEFCAAELHMAVCRDDVLPARPVTSSEILHGKVIVFARHAGRAHTEFCSWLSQKNNSHLRWPQYADLPQQAVQFSVGQPILTLFATGHRRGDVIERLESGVQEVHRKLVGTCSLNAAHRAFVDRSPP